MKDRKKHRENHRHRISSAEERFESNLDRWGADLNSWPGEAQEQARWLLATSTRALALLENQQQIDEALAGLKEHPVPADLQGRIMDRLPRPVPEPDRWQRIWEWFAGALWRPALAACAPLALGFLLGAMLSAASDRELADQFSTLALTDIYQEIADAQP